MQVATVSRFERNAATPTGRLHMEDFAQALELRLESNYEGNYAVISAVLQIASPTAEQDLFELLRRIKVNELLGNFDVIDATTSH